MQERKSLGLDEARKIVEAALEVLYEAKGRAASVAVVDNAGDLVHFSRMDGASPNSANVAINKAYTAIFWKMNTKEVRALLEESNMDIAWFGNPRYSPIRGGVLIKSTDGAILGAIGISGRIPKEPPDDEDVAQAGFKAYRELKGAKGS